MLKKIIYFLSSFPCSVSIRMMNHTNEPAAIKINNSTINVKINESLANEAIIKNFGINIGNKGVPIIAILPIIKPNDAKGCSFSIFRISPTLTESYCLWIIPAEKKRRAFVSA